MGGGCSAGAEFGGEDEGCQLAERGVLRQLRSHAVTKCHGVIRTAGRNGATCGARLGCRGPVAEGQGKPFLAPLPLR